MPPCVRTGVQEGRCQAHRARHGRQGQRAAPAAQGGPLCAGGEGAGAAARAGPHQDGRGAVRLPARGRTAVPHAAGGAEDAAQDAPPGPRPRRGLLRRRGVLPHHRLRALLQVGAPGHYPLHPAELQRGADWPGGRGRRSGGCGRQAGAGDGGRTAALFGGPQPGAIQEVRGAARFSDPARRVGARRGGARVGPQARVHPALLGPHPDGVL
mmetsp:Transcript_47849/g.119798  ORF Transcript_47849/g.119798 Transcript_47849/m.119798 type:complete len:211 (-) Transcript_47849:313-945(-)